MRAWLTKSIKDSGRTSPRLGRPHTAYGVDSDRVLYIVRLSYVREGELTTLFVRSGLEAPA